VGLGILFGVIATYVGLLLSYHLDIAAGASVVLVAVAIFFVVLLVQNLRARGADTTVVA
jgi:ABC-type Mn2+/Zn2+ transport system permease subunit